MDTITPTQMNECFILSILLFLFSLVYIGSGNFKFRGGGDENIGFKGGYSLENAAFFGPFVYCLWRVLLLLLIFSLFFSLPQNFRGDDPSLKMLVGDTSPASAACVSLSGIS